MPTKPKVPNTKELNHPIIPKPEDVPRGYDPERPWDVDQLERKEHAEILTKYVSGISQPYVLAVNAGWGQGKSLFLRMWRDELVNIKKRPCVLFNAWKSDFGDDPLVALMAAVTEQVVDYIDSQDDVKWKKLKEIVDKAKKTVGGIWNKKQTIAVNFIDHHLNKTGIDLKKSLSSPSNDRVNDFLKQQEIIEKFRSELKDLANELTSGEFPLIIMVDELDRCRPDYAVLLLERIKHLFSVKGVVFVLALEAEQLSKTISCLYGLDHDGSRVYLRRFIDMEYRLPEFSKEQFAKYVCTQFNLDNLPGQRLKDITSSHDPGLEHFEIHGLLAKLSKAFDLSLRDMAQVAAQTAAVARCYQANWTEICVALFFLVLRRQAPDDYELLQKKKINWDGFPNNNGNTTKQRLNSIPFPERTFLNAVINWFGMTEQQFKNWITPLSRESFRERRPHESDNKNVLYLAHAAIFVQHIDPSKDKILGMVEIASRFYEPNEEDIAGSKTDLG